MHIQVQSFQVSSVSLQMSFVCGVFFCIQLLISVLRLHKWMIDVCLVLTAELGFAGKTCAECSAHGQ